MVTVNNMLKFEIEIVHDLSCHPIVNTIARITVDVKVHASEPCVMIGRSIVLHMITLSSLGTCT